MKLFNKFKYVFILLFIVTYFSTSIYSANNTYPDHTSEFYVNDFANILSNDTENTVFNICREIDEKTKAQLVVTTVENMNGNTIEEYSNTLFNKWGIGSKENNGVLLLISKEERKIRIEVGYGLEGALNDGKTGRMIDDLAIPYLKNNDYDTAVINLTQNLQGIIYTEYNIEGGFDNYNEDTSIAEVFSLIIVIIIFVIIIIASKGRALFFLGGFPGSGGRFGGGSGGRIPVDSVAVVDHHGGGRFFKRFLIYINRIEYQF